MVWNGLRDMWNVFRSQMRGNVLFRVFQGSTTGLVFAVLWVTAGCGGTVAGIPTLIEIQIAGPTTVPEGGIGNYSIAAEFDTGLITPVTADVVWAVTSGPGSIDSDGVYSAPANVTDDTPVTVQASYTDAGVTISASKDVTARNLMRILIDVTISGPNTVAENGTAGFTLTAVYDDGSMSEVTGNAVWTVTTGPGSITASGVYSAPDTVVGDTTASVHASYTEGGTTRQAAKGIIIGESAKTLAAVTLDGPDTVAGSETASYTATATYDDGTTADVTGNAQWSMVGSEGTISTTGVYLAPNKLATDTTITLSVIYTENDRVEQATKNVAVTANVAPKAPTALMISGPSQIAEGSGAQHTAVALYSDGSSAEVVPNSWAVSSGPGQIDSSGLYSVDATVTSDSTVTISGTYAEGTAVVQGTHELTVTNETKFLTALALSGPSIVADDTLSQYTATASYDDGTTENVTQTAQWSLTDAVGTISSTGLYSAPPELSSDATVTINVAYAEGDRTEQASKAVTINASVGPTAVMILNISGPTEVAEGADAQYTAEVTYGDGRTENVTATNWTVSSGPGQISATGMYTAPTTVTADTAVTLSASYTEAAVTVQTTHNLTAKNTTRILDSLSISGPTTVTENTTDQYAAVATYDDGTTSSLGGSCTWSVDGGGTINNGIYAAPNVSADIAVTLHAGYTENGIAKQATRQITVTDTPIVLSETFDAYADGQEVPNWFDTDVSNSMTQNDALFSAADVGGRNALGTSSTLTNIHTHYITAESADWTNYEFTGMIMKTASTGGVGVTFLSDYPNSDVYYRLRQYGANGVFYIAPHGTDIDGGTTDTDVVPDANTWHRFRIEVLDVNDRTEIRAKVWADGTSEPTDWQVNCYDAGGTRRTRGTVGVWTMSSGDKYWDELVVTVQSGEQNEGPVADAGPDQPGLAPGETVTLDGTASYDPNGDTLTYLWLQTAGPAVALSSPSADRPTFAAANVTSTTVLTFSLSVSDGEFSALDTVNITVTPAASNKPPVASNGSASTTVDRSVAVTLAATDPEGQSLTYTIVSDPTSGTLSGTAPYLTYTPNSGFEGQDSLTFKANDGGRDSNVATVTITVSAAGVWTAPIGIPVPEFGIVETHHMYAEATYDFGSGPEPYKDAGNGPYTHYIDSSHPNATDSGNTYGTADTPRLTIPGTLEPGSVVEIHNGVTVPYTYGSNDKWIDGTGTPATPIFIRGIANGNGQRPRFDKRLRPRGSYIIIEGLHIDGTDTGIAMLRIIDPSHHIAFRHSEISDSSNTSGITITAKYFAGDVSHIVIYDNVIHDIGDWLASYDQDYMGVGIEADSLDSHVEQIWVVDNEMYHCSGNGVQILAHSAAQQPNLNHIYIGRNETHHNKQRGIGIKESEHVIVSQNTSYACRPVGQNPSNPGDGMGANYGPHYVWFLYNNIYDCDNGIRYSSGNTGPGEHVYIIGNIIRDIRHSTVDVTGQYPVAYDPANAWSPGKAITIWNSSGAKHIINNTIYNADGGIYITYNAANPTIIVNNIMANVDDGTEYSRHVRFQQGTTAGVSLLYNNLFDSLARIQWGSTSSNHSVASFQAAYPNNGWDNLEADPLFVDSGGADFSLSPNSPAVNAGAAYDAYQTFYDLYGIDIAVDFDGASRPQAGGWDIGAFETTEN